MEDRKLKINKNLFLELLETKKEDIIVEEIVPNTYIQIGFATEYSEDLKNEFKRIFDFFDIEIDEEEGFEFTGVYHKYEKENLEDTWNLGYTIFNGMESLEIDELLGTELDVLCSTLANEFLLSKKEPLAQINFIKNDLNKEEERKLVYSGIDMTNWNFSFDENDTKLIYKAFIALCNYAEEFIPCGKCPLFGKLCYEKSGENGEKFWDKVREELEGVDLCKNT